MKELFNKLVGRPEEGSPLVVWGAAFMMALFLFSLANQATWAG